MSLKSTRRDLTAILASRRLRAVSLLSISSGLPLGLVTVAIPAWMTMVGADIRTVGLLTAAQAPYAFKFLWAPLVDRLGVPGLSGKRGWIFASQIALAALTFALAAQAHSPQVGLVAALALLVALASATQDIAIDAYAVEVLQSDEQGLAVGTRTALYRAAMWLSGAIAISVGPLVGWSWTVAALALIYLALLPVTWRSPSPEGTSPPPQTLREAVLAPLIGLWLKPRALEIVAFVLLYKLADNLAVALVRPFLVQVGFAPIDVVSSRRSSAPFSADFGQTASAWAVRCGSSGSCRPLPTAVTRSSPNQGQTGRCSTRPRPLTRAPRGSAQAPSWFCS